ncbi:hypothetical protein AB0K00_31255 [Dactylosporangium sp. NPDC049525]|uniref:hypothetical protein n=1 Tax=Dactylosporangium sp. NPDC049525 TaxID=3154730 RepID=UPI00344A801B
MNTTLTVAAAAVSSRVEVLTDLGLTGQDVARHVTRWVSRLDVLAIRVPATSRA